MAFEEVSVKTPTGKKTYSQDEAITPPAFILRVTIWLRGYG
jgi:hypothetical protein